MISTLTRLAADRRSIALIQQCAVVAAGFLSGVALARQLGPVDRGQYSIVQTLYVLATPALSLGVPLKLMSRQVELPHRSVAILHYGAASIAIGIVTMFIAPPPVRLLVAVLSLGPALVSWSEMLMTRTGSSDKLQYIRTADVMTSSVIIILLHICGGLTLGSATIALYFPTIVLRGTAVAATWRSYVKLPTIRHARPLYRSAVAKLWPRELLSVSSMYADIIVAAMLLGPRALGIYAIASALGKLALAPFSALYGETVRRATAGESLKSMFKTLIPLPTIIVCIGAVGAALCGKSAVVAVFGNEYAESAASVPFLLMAFLLGGLASMLETITLIASPAAVSASSRLIALVAGCSVWMLAIFEPGLSRTVVVVAGLLTMNLTAMVLTGRRLIRAEDDCVDTATPKAALR